MTLPDLDSAQALENGALAIAGKWLRVVLSLATAVKELLENSLDASATSVQIRLKEFGTEGIEVVDNGFGVEEANFEALTLKHYTSKISDFADVASVETFGFRGEALSSLCALGKVSIATRHKSVEVGTHLRMDYNGAIVDKFPIARQVGTTVTIENLFCTLPVRHKEFLRNTRKEFAKMCNVIYGYALLNSHCSITCTNRTGGRIRPVMETRAGSVRNNIISIFGAKQNVGLMEVQSVAPDEEMLSEFRCSKSAEAAITVSGFISSCAHGLGRSSPDRQFFYINGRPVDNSKIARLINDVYHFYNPHQSPFVFLDIRVTEGCVDVNVVPDKRQILLEHEGLLLATVKSSLLAVFHNVPATMPLQLTRVPERRNVMNPSTLDILGKFSSSEANVTNSVAAKTQTSLSKFLIRNSPSQMNKAKSCLEKDTIDDDFGHSNKKMKFEIIIDPILDSVTSLIDRPLSETEVSSKIIDLNATPDELSYPSVPDINDEISSMDSAILSQESCVAVKLEPERETMTLNIFDMDVNEERSQGDSKSRRQSTDTIKSSSIAVKGIQQEVFVKEVALNNSVTTNETTKHTFDDGITDIEKQKRRVVVHDVSLDKLILARRSRVVASQEEVNVKFFAKIEPSNNDRAEEELRRELTQDAFTQMKVLGQFNKGFIIVLLNKDLFIIDQHATDEKFNFEKLSAEKLQSQRLTVPQSLRLTAANEELLKSRLDVFKANGFDFLIDDSADATERVRLTSVPIAKGITLGHREVDELLFMLEDAPDGLMCRPSRVRDIMASRACRMSIMVGTPLNKKEMRRLVSHMAEMAQPWNCPHGRPTIRHLVSLDLLCDL